MHIVSEVQTFQGWSKYFSDEIYILKGPNIWTGGTVLGGPDL